MNQIILRRMADKIELRNQLRNPTLVGNQPPSRKDKMREEPNLELNMLRRERNSEKRQGLVSERYHHLENEVISSSKTRDIYEQRKGRSLSKKRGEQAPLTNSQDQQPIKNSHLNLKRRQLYLYCKNRAKDCSQSLNKINTTAPASQKTPRDIVRERSLDRSHFKKIEVLSKSQSCKTRPSPYLLNPEEILQSFQRLQAKDIGKRIVLKMNREKDKHLYEQAITHLFELAKHDMLTNKVRSQMPHELDVKEIIIPRKGYKEDWIEKVKKYKESAIKNRQQKKKEGEKAQRQTQTKGQVRLRAKTDTKISNQQIRNRTQAKDQLWMGLIEKPFSPWQYESLSSKLLQ